MRSHPFQLLGHGLSCRGTQQLQTCFNATLDLLAATFCELAQQKKWGYWLSGRSYANLLLFADNFWLLATSAPELAEMSAEWLEILNKFGWEVPLDELTWCTTAQDDLATGQVTIQGHRVRRNSRAEAFKVLGTCVTFDNSFELELQNRISRAWRAFWKCSDICVARQRVLRIALTCCQCWCRPLCFGVAGVGTSQRARSPRSVAFSRPCFTK